ncbi:FK506-binding protein 4-like [Fagus crenata]
MTKALVGGRWTLAFRDEESLCYIAQSSNSDQVRDSCSAHGSGNNRGVGTDLNLRLGPFVDGTQEKTKSRSLWLRMETSVRLASWVNFLRAILVVESARVVHVDYVVAVEKSSEGECDPKENALELVAEKALEISEITNQQRVESSELIDEETKLEEEDKE